MKPLFILLAVAASFFTTNSFAAKEDITPVVLKSFQNSFSAAREVTWSATTNYYKAQFEWNGQQVLAFYEPGGALVALTRNISSLELPITLQANLKKEYGNYWISDLFELTTDSGTSYYATVENADSKIVVKSDSATTWKVFQKSEK